MTVPEKTASLRELMKKNNIGAYIVSSSDPHLCEYVSERFRCREYMTGFTGSAGTAVITANEAALWTDGRYFIQAESELKGSGYILQREGEPETPSVAEYILNALAGAHGGGKIPENRAAINAAPRICAFDGRVLCEADFKKLQRKLSPENIPLNGDFDLVGEIWKNRPPLSSEPAFMLDIAYAGEEVSSKLSRLRARMKALKSDAHIISAPDEICWLLNLRGNDIPCCPVFYSYAVIFPEEAHLFADREKFSSEILDALSAVNVTLHPYESVFDFVRGMSAATVLIDPAATSHALYAAIPKGCHIKESLDPCVLLKAVKNKVEISNLKKAHLRDAVAHVKFLCRLKRHFRGDVRNDSENAVRGEADDADKPDEGAFKTEYGGEANLVTSVTELTAQEVLEKLRMDEEGYIEPSFSPISAAGSHSAVCHYSSSENTDRTLREGEFYLCDTGGHYLYGTTDITRTVALGAISDELKKDYTTVLRGNLKLSGAVFPEGTKGVNLDILARGPLWSRMLDYRHATGHGIGYLLNVHEGPQVISGRGKSLGENVPLRAGMVISDEPGIYIEGSHGVRLENELLVKEYGKSEYGNFLCFEVLTLVPFDLDAIDASMLSDEEKEALNAYHRRVRRKVSPYLTPDEADWLETATREI